MRSVKVAALIIAGFLAAGALASCGNKSAKDSAEISYVDFGEGWNMNDSAQHAVENFARSNYDTPNGEVFYCTTLSDDKLEEMKSDSEELQYGYVDVPGRRLYFVGKEPEILPEYCRPFEVPQQDRSDSHRMTMEKYLSMLFEAQEVTPAASPEEAEIILTMEKSAEEKGVSLVDRNFYLEG